MCKYLENVANVTMQHHHQHEKLGIVKTIYVYLNKLSIIVIIEFQNYATFTAL